MVAIDAFVIELGSQIYNDPIENIKFLYHNHSKVANLHHQTQNFDSMGKCIPYVLNQHHGR